MIRRLLAVAAVSSLFAVAASGCQVPGTAAQVGDTRIPMSRVDALYEQALADPAARQLASRFPAQTRQAIVDTLVGTEFLRQAAELEGISVTPVDIDRMKAQVAANRDRLAQRVRAATAQDFAQLPAEQVAGVAKALLPVDVLARDEAYRSAVDERMQAGSPDQEQYDERVTSFLDRAAKAIPVTVNPRFGSFDPRTFFRGERQGLAPAPQVAVTRLPAGTPTQAPREDVPERPVPSGPS
ncbi:MAG TPA: hypothetical protein VGR21_03060 [Cryptosporangiaceae bacterium]|nr:hypothetical protein [Cryptosporangiaceae bacterium]